MLDFFNWCVSNNLTLPTVMENSTRTGIKPQYPEGYLRSQYPDGYFIPSSATAFLNLKQSKTIKNVSAKTDKNKMKDSE